MIYFPDLTEKELEVRRLLTRKRSEFEKRNTPFAIWAQQTRDAWAATPEGQRAIRECESKRAKVRRVVAGAPSEV